MKRKLMIILISLLGFILVGCGDKKDISKMDNSEIVEEYKIDLKANTVTYIEQLQMIKIKALGPDTKIQEFSTPTAPVFDTDGNEYPYTYFLHGQFETKQTGELFNYSMILGYKTKEDIENMSGTCLEYYNKTSGQTYSIIDDSRSN